MENENKVIALSQKNLLAKVNSSIGITNKLIAENNKKLVVEIFERNPKFFIDLISKFYPLNVEMVAYSKYLNWDSISLYNDLTNILLELDTEYLYKIKTLKWDQLGGNKNIKWSEKIISSHFNKWCWISLSYNISIPFNTQIIDKFSNKWRWQWLQTNRSFPWDFELVEKYENILDMEDSLTCSNIPLSVNLIEKYKNIWKEENWSLISSLNKYITWKEILLFKDYFIWEDLSRNENLIWTLELIEQFKDKLNWAHLSENAKLPWNLELLKEYEEKWDWYNISNNQGVEWSQELIKIFENKLYFKSKWTYSKITYDEYYGKSLYGLSSNKGVIWSENLIERYTEKWNWKKLSEIAEISWSCAFIEKHKEKLDWVILSRNSKINWSEDLIEKYKSRWKWSENISGKFFGFYYFDLSSNEHLPWSESFIDKYAKRWNWSNLFDNMGINWSVKLIHKHSDKLICSNNDTPSSIWNTLSPYIDDELVINLLEDIKNGKIEIKKLN